MNTDRRGFLKLLGGGVVASATMAEAGLFAEFMDWMRRKPVFSIPTVDAFDPIMEQVATEMTYRAAATLDSLARIYYDKAFIANLKCNTPLFGMLESKELTKAKGVSLSMYQLA